MKTDAPLWRRAAAARAAALVTAQHREYRAVMAADAAKQREENRSARARLALQALLAKAQHPVSLTTIHMWTRAQQAQAHCWATAFVVLGREDVPPPPWVYEASK